jgi:prophage DNA circulation protein
VAWDDRIVDALYTSPSGKEIDFKIDEASHDVELKTSTFTFPDKDGGRVQHQGAGAKTFPITAIFDGPDCMDRADQFEAMLIEMGVAEFQHPVYGTLKVVPTGNIKRRDGLVSELNQSTVTITLTETIADEEAPALDIVSADAIDVLYDDFSENAAADFAEGISADTVSEQLQVQSVLTDQTLALNENLGPLVSGDPAKKANFLTTIRELKNNIQGYFNQAEKVVQKGLSIGRQELNVMKAPSRMIMNLTEKIKGYTQLITRMVNQFRNDPYGIKNIKNAFVSTRLVLSGAAASIASGSALSIVNAASVLSGSGTPAESAVGVTSREAAIDAAVRIISLLETVKEFEDAKVEEDVFVDHNASSYFQLQQLVYASARLIMDDSFSLPMRRTITLGRDRQIIELCCELYGSEDYLDRFIQENNFNLDEIELLPMGKEVSYYVESA